MASLIEADDRISVWKTIHSGHEAHLDLGQILALELPDNLIVFVDLDRRGAGPGGEKCITVR